MDLECAKLRTTDSEKPGYRTDKCSTGDETSHNNRNKNQVKHCKTIPNTASEGQKPLRRRKTDSLVHPNQTSSIRSRITRQITPKRTRVRLDKKQRRFYAKQQAYIRLQRQAFCKQLQGANKRGSRVLGVEARINHAPLLEGSDFKKHISPQATALSSEKYAPHTEKTTALVPYT